MKPAEGITYVTDKSTEHWFKVKDVGEYLEYQKGSIDITIEALVKNIYPKAVTHFSNLVLSDRSDAQMRHDKIEAGELMINEKGIFVWFMSSRKPRAKPFKKWLCENAKIYGGETPSFTSYWNDATIKKDIAQVNEKYHTGFVFIATSADYEKKEYYIIRRSQKYHLGLDNMNSIMLEASMQLKPKLIWKSSSYQNHKSKLEEIFKEYRYKSFFKLNEEKLNRAKELMKQLGAKLYPEEAFQKEKQTVLEKLESYPIPDEADDGEVPDPIPKIADEASSTEADLPVEGVAEHDSSLSLGRIQIHSES